MIFCSIQSNSVGSLSLEPLEPPEPDLPPIPPKLGKLTSICAALSIASLAWLKELTIDSAFVRATIRSTLCSAVKPVVGVLLIRDARPVAWSITTP